MMKAQTGDGQAYEQLLRELDAWLCRYYARRLPHPAAEDARQNTLLAIHAKRHTYAPSKPFGAWVFAIARYKWIDCMRDASRYSTLSPDEEIPVEDYGRAAVSAVTLDHLLGQLNPAQESVIRLVKLGGLSIASASGATGQSTSLVKINIHVSRQDQHPSRSEEIGGLGVLNAGTRPPLVLDVGLRQSGETGGPSIVGFARARMSFVAGRIKRIRKSRRRESVTHRDEGFVWLMT
nr:sigma factor [Bradyrhizobium canariense]